MGLLESSQRMTLKSKSSSVSQAYPHSNRLSTNCESSSEGRENAVQIWVKSAYSRGEKKHESPSSGFWKFDGLKGCWQHIPDFPTLQSPLHCSYDCDKPQRLPIRAAKEQQAWQKKSGLFKKKGAGSLSTVSKLFSHLKRTPIFLMLRRSRQFRGNTVAELEDSSMGMYWKPQDFSTDQDFSTSWIFLPEVDPSYPSRAELETPDPSRVELETPIQRQAELHRDGPLRSELSTPDISTMGDGDSPLEHAIDGTSQAVHLERNDYSKTLASSVPLKNPKPPRLSIITSQVQTNDFQESNEPFDINNGGNINLDWASRFIQVSLFGSSRDDILDPLKASSSSSSTSWKPASFVPQAFGHTTPDDSNDEKMSDEHVSPMSEAHKRQYSALTDVTDPISPGPLCSDAACSSVGPTYCPGHATPLFTFDNSCLNKPHTGLEGLHSVSSNEGKSVVESSTGNLFLAQISTDVVYSDLKAPEAFLKEIEAHMNLQHRHWLKELKSSPHPTLSYNNACEISPLLRGLGMLQRHYQHQSSRGLKDNVALMQLVFALALKYHENDLSYTWDLLYKHLQAWKCFIEPRQESDTFLQAVKSAWNVLRGTVLTHRRTTLSLQDQLTAVSTTFPTFNLEILDDNQLQEQSEPFSQIFRNRLPMRLWSRFLCEYEYLDLAEKNSTSPLYSLPSTASSFQNIQFLRLKIFEPLILLNGTYNVWNDVLDVERKLSEGYLSTVREIEITLLSKVDGWVGSGLSHDQSSLLISLLCDLALRHSSPRWRDIQYNDDLEKIQATVHNLQRDEPQKLCNGKEIKKPMTTSKSSVAIGHPIHASNASYLSTISHVNPELPNSPATKLESTQFHLSGQESDGSLSMQAKSVESRIRPPTKVTKLHPSNSSIDLACSTMETSKCLLCGELFKGTLQHRNSNLKRHMRYKHESSSKLSCPAPACKRKFTRPDNLRKHHKTAHGRWSM